MNTQTTGQRIILCRADLGITQRELGAKPGIPTATVKYYESGMQKVTTRTGTRLAAALGVHLSWLLYGGGVPVQYTYASVELLGHIDLQACKVREIDDLGGKALEVTALKKDARCATYTETHEPQRKRPPRKRMTASLSAGN